MAYSVIFWRPRSGINVWLPAGQPLGEAIRTETLAGRLSECLDRFPADAMFRQLESAFPEARRDQDGHLAWSDELENGFVARYGEQFVSVCSFDLADDDLDRIFTIADEFGCDHYDWGN